MFVVDYDSDSIESLGKENDIQTNTHNKDAQDIQNKLEPDLAE